MTWPRRKETDMSSFTSALVVTPMDDGKSWKLVKPFDYELGEEGSGKKIEVPTGFITDFASIPRPMWVIYPVWGLYGKAAVLHDFMYATGMPTKRAECDAIFLEAMGVLKVPWIRRHIIYRGVRLGGWLAWKAHRAKDAPAVAPVTPKEAQKAVINPSKDTLDRKEKR